MTKEELERVLGAAVVAGVISDLNTEQQREPTHFARNVYFVSVEGCACSVEWYKNLMTLYIGGLSLWFDHVALTNTHPSYRVELAFSYHGNRVAFIGVK
ncbi:TPA: hypothetical protein ACXHW4_004257 [Enterobacter hormaechei]